MWVIDSIMHLFSYFLNICVLFFRCRERERRCTTRTSTILFSSLSLTDPVQPWSELGKAISYQAAFLYRPPRLCHCVLTSCACAPGLSGLLSHSSNTFFNYSVRVCFENRLCSWVAVCVCVYLTCLLCNNSVKCVKWEWRTHPSLSSYRHCGCDAQIWTHLMPVSMRDIRDDVSGQNIMNLWIPLWRLIQLIRFAGLSSPLYKGINEAAGSSWSWDLVIIMTPALSSSLATDSVSTLKGSFWHQRLWRVEMDAAALNVICFTVKCSHLAFFIEELARYDRLGHTKAELMSW